MFDRAYEFAFIRGPWDRQVSLYPYILAIPHHYRHKVVKGLGSFEAFVRWWVQNDTRTQSSFWADERNELLVDFVGQFNRTEQAFAHVSDRLGPTVELPRVNTSERCAYRDYYDAVSRRLIGEHYADAIERFGFEF